MKDCKTAVSTSEQGAGIRSRIIIVLCRRSVVNQCLHLFPMNRNLSLKSIIILLTQLIFNTAISQTFPDNFNLIKNGSFEFGESYPYPNSYVLITDTSFVNNPYCWLRVNGTQSLIIEHNLPDKEQYSNGDRSNRGERYVPLQLAVNSSSGGVTMEKFIEDSSVIARAYMQTKLLTPLAAGTTYTFAMYVGAAKSKFATLGHNRNLMTNIGVHFSSYQLRDYGNIHRVNVAPQLRFTQWDIDGVDTFMYVKLSASYTSSGGEEYLTIGNFDFASQFNIAYVDTLYDQVSFYSHFEVYIDDVSLVADNSLPIVNPDLFDLGNDTLVCSGDPIIIGGGSGFFSYLWNNGETTQYITVSQTGEYWCTVDYGCGSYTDSILVTFPEEFPLPHLGEDTFNCSEYDLLLEIPLSVDAFANTKIRWSTGDTVSTIKVIDPGVYWVNVSTECFSFYDTIQLKGCRPKIIDEIPLPNAFTPNGDGRNDVFRIPYPKGQIVGVELRIFNRWGQTVYILRNVKDAWDGANCDMGVYFYSLKYLDNTGAVHFQKGEVTLIR